MAGLKLVDATPGGTADFEFLIDERYMNINDVMHGGAAGVIFDMCTTTALGPLSRPGFWEYVFPYSFGVMFWLWNCFDHDPLQTLSQEIDDSVDTNTSLV